MEINKVNVSQNDEGIGVSCELKIIIVKKYTKKFEYDKLLYRIQFFPSCEVSTIMPQRKPLDKVHWI